jgi:hypothetical protein
MRLFIRVVLTTFLALILPSSALQAQVVTPTQTPTPGSLLVNRPGFGDNQNDWSWSMAWSSANNKLYVGSNRSIHCVTDWTIQYAKPTSHSYSTQPDPCISCAPDIYNMDLRAEIWSYTPATDTWAQVYISPTVPNPLHQEAGKQLALDIGYRGMIEYQEADGTTALYVAGVSAREFTPGMPLPRILRSTDGVNFTPVPLNLTGVPANISIMGFRSMTAFNGKMYITGSTDLLGEGVLLESTDPKNGVFRMVTIPAMQVYEMAAYNGELYVGLGDFLFGYSVWKTTATGNPPYKFTPVVNFGAGRGPVMVSVVSMHVFNNALYVGASGWSLDAQSEMIRINTDDSWNVIVGKARRDPISGVNKAPLSGLTDGFGNPWNGHIWRMETFNGSLYAGTNDGSWWYRDKPLLPPQYIPGFGFDLFSSPDGVTWSPVTQNGFGTGSNYGCRTMAGTPVGLFVGSTNECLGTEVFLYNPPVTPMVKKP